MSDKTRTKIAFMISKILNGLTKAGLLFLVFFFVYGCIFSPDLKLFNAQGEVYPGEWIYEKPDGSEETITLPVELDAPSGEAVKVKTILPDYVEDGMYICTSTRRNFRVYIDDEQIYSFDISNRCIPGGIVKSVYIPIPLKNEYAGKTFTIVRDDKDNKNGNLPVVFIGNLYGIVATVFKRYGGQFLAGFLLAIASALTIIIFKTVAKSTGNKIPLIYLAEGVFAISMWVMSDSPIFQFLFSKYYVDGVAGYFITLLLSAPFISYFDSIQNYRNKGIYNLLQFCVVTNFIVLTILHFTDIWCFRDSLLYIDVCILVYVVIIIIVSIRDRINNKEIKDRHTFVLIGFIVMGVFALAEVIYITFSIHSSLDVNFDGAFIIMGIFALLGFATYDQIKELNKLQSQTQNAITASKLKSEFLANMSHEIRTPINAIMGMNEMILRESEDANIRDYAKDVHSASENLLEIVNDILDFSKIEAGMLEIIEDDYNFGELIFDVTTLINMRAENKGLKFKIMVNPELPKILHGDDKRIKEVLINVLNNAVKYTSVGYIKFKIGGEVIDDEVLLNFEITDTGQGIKPENIDKIFGEFIQAELKKNKSIEGTGLGLSITKKLLDLLGGSISVESTYGRGSTFTIQLKQKIVDSEPMGDYKNHRHASKPEVVRNDDFEAPMASVLVVDDSELNLLVISRLLAKTKMEIVCVESGQEALEYMAAQRFDIILLDHMMPNMDGIETLEAAKSMDNNKCKRTPIIMLTANALVGAKDVYMAAGFDDYLSKPVVPKDLEDMILKYLSEEKIVWL